MEKKSYITADWKKIMDDAPNTVNNFLYRAIESIDHHLGKDYAKLHPELLGSFITASAIEEQGYIIGKCILELRDSINELNTGIWNSSNYIADRT